MPGWNEQGGRGIGRCGLMPAEYIISSVHLSGLPRSHLRHYMCHSSSRTPADIRSVCVRRHSESSEPTLLFSQTTPDEHPPTPPPSRWPALVTLPHLAKFQLVWRRVRDVGLFASCLFEHTLTAVCVQREYQVRRKYCVHS